MARQLKRLTARTVASLTKPGRHADGGNLYLTISRTRRLLEWILTRTRATDGGQRRERCNGGFLILILGSMRRRRRFLPSAVAFADEID
jgi:hypothetical protein